MAVSDRLVSFVHLADDILANPWAQRDAPVTRTYVADSDGSGRGIWELSGPSELELSALLIHLRNVTQPTSPQFLPRILADIAGQIEDEVLWDAIERGLEAFGRDSDRGTTVIDGIPVLPWQVAQQWMYARYHHRDLDRIRQIQQLDPLTKFVLHGEFLLYLQSVLTITGDSPDRITESPQA